MHPDAESPEPSEQPFEQPFEQPVEAVLTPQQVADELHVTRQTVYNMTGDGRLPCFKVGNRKRIKRSVLRSYISSNTIRREDNR
ncbi:MAG TPA: helix-turn-helix domain-containing protein [Chloroflexota bacterium]|nr:helix-turn-helix domain-containing protein [Chloroflexota bacterium]